MNNISIHSIDTVCLKEACRYITFVLVLSVIQKLRKSEKVFSILNPDHIACNEQGCAYRLRGRKSYAWHADSAACSVRYLLPIRLISGTFRPISVKSTYCRQKRGAILIAQYKAEITASLRAEWRRYQHRFR